MEPAGAGADGLAIAAGISGRLPPRSRAGANAMRARYLQIFFPHSSNVPDELPDEEPEDVDEVEEDEVPATVVPSPDEDVLVPPEVVPEDVVEPLELEVVPLEVDTSPLDDVLLVPEDELELLEEPEDVLPDELEPEAVAATSVERSLAVVSAAPNWVSPKIAATAITAARSAYSTVVTPAWAVQILSFAIFAARRVSVLI
jgi:hypothetical protein